MRAKVSITWREELVDTDRSFYVKLSPDVNYSIVGVEDAKKKIADKIVKDLQQAVKNNKKVK